MTESNQELFENYLNGSLTKSETDAFELELDQNLKLKKEFFLYKEIEVAFKDNDAKDIESIMHSIASKHSEDASRATKKGNKFLYLAALIVGLLIASYVIKISSQTVSHQELYASYFEPYKAYGITRTNQSKSNSQLALIAYNNQDYVKAVALYESESQLDNKGKFYYASALLSLGNTDDALRVFKEISNSGDTEWREQSLWYAGLSELKLGKYDDARTTLHKISKTSNYYQSSSEIISRFKHLEK